LALTFACVVIEKLAFTQHLERWLIPSIYLWLSGVFFPLNL